MEDEEDIALCPLTGWTTGTLPEGHVMALLRYVNTPEQLETGVRFSVRLVMTDAQADALAEEIRSTSAKSRLRQTGGSEVGPGLRAAAPRQLSSTGR